MSFFSLRFTTGGNVRENVYKSFCRANHCEKVFLITFLIVSCMISPAYCEKKNAGAYRYIIEGWQSEVSFTIPYPADLEMDRWMSASHFRFSSQMNTAASAEPVEIRFDMEDISYPLYTEIEGYDLPAGHYLLYNPVFILAPDGSIKFHDISEFGWFINKAWQKPYVNAEKGWSGDMVLADWGYDRGSGNEPYGMCDLYLFLKDENGQYTKAMNASNDIDCRINKEAYKDLISYMELFQTETRPVTSETAKMDDGNTYVRQTTGSGTVSFIDPTANAPEAPYRLFKETIEGPEGAFGGYRTAIRLAGTAEGKPVVRDCHLELSYHIRTEGAEKLLPLSELTASHGKLLGIKNQPPDGNKPAILKQRDVAGRNWSGSLIYDSVYEGTQYDGSDTKRAEMFFFVTVSSPLDVLFTLRFKTIPPSNLPAEWALNAIHVTDDTIADIMEFIRNIELSGTRLDRETRRVVDDL